VGVVSWRRHSAAGPPGARAKTELCSLCCGRHAQSAVRRIERGTPVDERDSWVPRPSSDLGVRDGTFRNRNFADLITPAFADALASPDGANGRREPMEPTAWVSLQRGVREPHKALLLSAQYFTWMASSSSFVISFHLFSVQFPTQALNTWRFFRRSSALRRGAGACCPVCRP